eukprot:CAMPEP_0119036098 /NCGR_PEP_ID=MMETSP1177-20130426/3584_1 /TAXON_ID=2985 /ORGANISM="Ochromonas sp, Strain CCMP1899" /LENGTH=57 /DNA_ID=CAMNT_0006995403 /DNA_START=34 /DNA_END=207 /DNA_ORIENTATION=-
MAALISEEDVQQLQNEDRYIALHYAASNGLLSELKILLAAGIDTNVQDQVHIRGEKI